KNLKICKRHLEISFHASPSSSSASTAAAPARSPRSSKLDVHRAANNQLGQRVELVIATDATSVLSRTVCKRRFALLKFELQQCGIAFLARCIVGSRDKVRNLAVDAQNCMADIASKLPVRLAGNV